MTAFQTSITSSVLSVEVCLALCPPRDVNLQLQSIPAWVGLGIADADFKLGTLWSLIAVASVQLYTKIIILQQINHIIRSLEI